MRHHANLIGPKIGKLRYARGWTQDVLAAIRVDRARLEAGEQMLGLRFENDAMAN